MFKEAVVITFSRVFLVSWWVLLSTELFKTWFFGSNRKKVISTYQKKTFFWVQIRIFRNDLFLGWATRCCHDGVRVKVLGLIQVIWPSPSLFYTPTCTYDIWIRLSLRNNINTITLYSPMLSCSLKWVNVASFCQELSIWATHSIYVHYFPLGFVY